jgi:hypothetical protein
MEAADTSLALPNWALISRLQKESFYGAQLKVTRSNIVRVCGRCSELRCGNGCGS